MILTVYVRETAVDDRASITLTATSIDYIYNNWKKHVNYIFF